MRPIAVLALSLLALLPITAQAQPSQDVYQEMSQGYRVRLQKLGGMRANHVLCVGEITSSLSNITVDELSMAKAFGMTVDQANDVIRDAEIMVRAEMGQTCRETRDWVAEYRKAREDHLVWMKAELEKSKKSSQ